MSCGMSVSVCVIVKEIEKEERGRKRVKGGYALACLAVTEE